MKNPLHLLTALLISILLTACSTNHISGNFPSGIDHAPYNTLLKKYVNDRGLVNYAAWKSNKVDSQALDTYLDQFAKTNAKKSTGKELGASATNAYNAFAIRTIIQNYPTKSIRDIDNAFTAKTHNVGGKKLSLDDIEKGNAIPALGPIAHSIVVCCAKSCPPLQNTAYTKENIDELSKTAAQTWLAREDLNNFSNEKIEISKIFDWYEDDFKGESGVKKFLITHTPKQTHNKIKNAKITYKDYNWKLNAQ